MGLSSSMQMLLLSEDPHYADDVECLFSDIFTREKKIEPMQLSEFEKIQKSIFEGAGESIVDACNKLQIPYVMVGITKEIAQVQKFFFPSTESELETTMRNLMFSQTWHVGMILQFFKKDFVIIGRFMEKGSFAVTSTRYFEDFQDQPHNNTYTLVATAD